MPRGPRVGTGLHVSERWRSGRRTVGTTNIRQEMEPSCWDFNHSPAARRHIGGCHWRMGLLPDRQEKKWWMPDADLETRIDMAGYRKLQTFQSPFVELSWCAGAFRLIGDPTRRAKKKGIKGLAPPSSPTSFRDLIFDDETDTDSGGRRCLLQREIRNHPSGQSRSSAMYSARMVATLPYRPCPLCQSPLLKSMVTPIIIGTMI